MCGIAGTIGVPRDVAEPALARMRAALYHRGPDDRGSELVTSAAGLHPVGLAHTRLAIIDTSSNGRQPMRDVAGPWITFNGEIYNFASVRADLEKVGFPCHGRTDTEVILRAYAAWGPDGVTRLRGMFAFVLADPDKGVVWLCRDRMGIKPLYVVRPTGGGLLFASEVRALLAAGPELVRPRVSATALESFFAQGMVCGLDSIIEGIASVAPGTSLVTAWDGSERSRRAYWSLPSSAMPLVWTSRAEAVSNTARTLREAVGCHLVSDVPLGLFLSGGIDSSAIATIATDVSSQVRTLAIGFDQPRFDESPTAERVAADLHTEHSTVRLTGDEMLSDMGEVFAAMDQPTVDGFNTYFVSRAARRAGLTVALSGIGGDELFGGYDTFRDVPRALAVARMTHFLLGRDGDPAAERVASLRWKPPVAGRAAAKLVELLHRDPTLAAVYLLRRELFLAAERRALHARPAGADADVGLPLAQIAELTRIATKADPINAISSLELVHYLRYMLLRDADVFSMAVGLEVRVPLLDHELVEAVSPLPGRWKRPDRARAKPLLLDAVGERLPHSVETRKKRGFAFPWQAWLTGPLRERARKALIDRDVWRSLGVGEEAPERMWGRFLEGDPRVGALQIIALWVLSEYAQRMQLLPPR